MLVPPPLLPSATWDIQMGLIRFFKRPRMPLLKFAKWPPLALVRLILVESSQLLHHFSTTQILGFVSGHKHGWMNLAETNLADSHELSDPRLIGFQ